MSADRFPKGQLLGALAVGFFGVTSLVAVLHLEALVAPIFVVGFFLVIPLIAILGDALPFVASEGEGQDDDQTHEAPLEATGTADVGRDDGEETDPVARLRERYARGELDDVAFERKLERLLETEGLEGVVDPSTAVPSSEQTSGDSIDEVLERDATLDGEEPPDRDHEPEPE